MTIGACMRSYLRIGGGLVRVAMLGIVTLALVVALSSRAAVVQADDALMELGRHLIALSETGLARDSRGIVVNGQQIGLRVFTTEHDPETVLDYFDDWCRGGLGEFSAEEEELFVVNQSSSQVGASDDRSWRDLTMRDMEGNAGFVGCIKHGIPGATATELGERMMAFFGTGNLRDLGQFHYAAVTRIEHGTRVVAVWTDGDFYPGAMFPAAGDAPGFDAAGVSRPPSGRRMLSAGEIGHSETLTMYTDSDQTIPELVGFYRRDFLRRGWHVLTDTREGDSLQFFVVQRGREMRVVSLSREPGSKTSVTIATTN